MQSKSVFVPKLRFISILTAVLLPFLLLPSISTAQDIFSSSEDEFLPVEQAYQLTPSIESETVRFSWVAAEGYYLYRHQFSLQAKTLDDTFEVALSIPDGLKKYDEIFEKELEVYYHSVELSAALPEVDGPYELQLNSQGCADAGLCYPPRTQYFSVIDNVITETPQSTIIETTDSPSLPAKPVDAQQQSSLLLVLLGAIIGGMILNLMPCVFPVLSLKALHLTSGSAAQHRSNGWSYTAGVVLSFALFGAIIAAAKSSGAVLGWGFQLQQPIFVAALIYLFFLLSLNLFGFFEIGTSWMGAGQSLTQGEGLAPSFFTGVLAAIVASPCTAPFMATAIGYTLTQGAGTTLVVFSSLGLGMALPYLLLTHVPRIAHALPAPGAWMDTFKQFLAFPLLFTCIWLLVVLGNQSSVETVAYTAAGAVCLAMAIWLWKKQPKPVSFFSWLCRLSSVALVVVAIAVALNPRVEEQAHASEQGWQAYSPETLKTLRAAGTPVFIDLTADWCITCKINERVAIDTDTVGNFSQQHNIVMMRGDWTRADPQISDLLHQFGRNGVPLYLMYPSDPSGAPEVLPQILTSSIVLAAMERSIQ